MELDDKIYECVKELANSGNELLDEGQYDKAIAVFQEALELLPTPWFQWEAATWLYAAIGDTYFQKKDFVNAKEAFFDALNCPDGQTNPFIHLRLGQSLFELGELEEAKEHLLRAYMLEGESIFRGESRKYLNFLKQHIDHL